MQEYLITSEVTTSFIYRVHAENVTDALTMVENKEQQPSQKFEDWDGATTYCTAVDGEPFTPEEA